MLTVHSLYRCDWHTLAHSIKCLVSAWFFFFLNKYIYIHLNTTAEHNEKQKTTFVMCAFSYFVYCLTTKCPILNISISLTDFRLNTKFHIHSHLIVLDCNGIIDCWFIHIDDLQLSVLYYLIIYRMDWILTIKSKINLIFFNTIVSFFFQSWRRSYNWTLNAFETYDTIFIHDWVLFHWKWTGVEGYRFFIIIFTQ